MESREHKLHAATEIHRLNRDVADALARIQEKLNSIADTVGKVVNLCEGKLRQHELVFQRDLGYFCQGQATHSHKYFRYFEEPSG